MAYNSKCTCFYLDKVVTESSVPPYFLFLKTIQLSTRYFIVNGSFLFKKTTIFLAIKKGIQLLVYPIF